MKSFIFIFGIIFSFWRLGSGVTKRFLSLDDEDQTVFCYLERGTPVENQPTIVFIHGFAGNKRSWVNVVRVNRKQRTY